MAPPGVTKADLRREMRSARRALAGRPERSERLWALVEALEPFRLADTVMVYDSIEGEPITTPFVERCRASSRRVVVPEQLADLDASDVDVDVVIVPGLAFTPAGDRLGQGGGWYDRFLAGVDDRCVAIGVGFEMQIVDHLPVEAHDIRLPIVVTETQVRHTLPDAISRSARA